MKNNPDKNMLYFDIEICTSKSKHISLQDPLEKGMPFSKGLLQHFKAFLCLGVKHLVLFLVYLFFCFFSGFSGFSGLIGLQAGKSL